MTLIEYFLTMVVMVLTSAIKRKDRSSDVKYIFSFGFPIIVYTFFWGLRYDVGIDYLSYMKSYLSCTNKDDFEYGYRLFQNILKYLDLPYPFLFIITSFINICSIYILGKNKGQFFLCLLVLFYWSSESVYFAQNGLRQMLAISMCFFAIRNLIDDKIFRSFVFFTLAFSFHVSSIIFSLSIIIIFFISKRKIMHINKYVVLSIYLASEFYGQFFSISDITFVNDFIRLFGYEHYLNRLDSLEIEEVTSSGLGVILRMLIFSCVILYKNRLFEDEDCFKIIFYWLFVIGAVFWPVLNSNMIFNRICIYFTSTYFVTFAFFGLDLCKRSNNRIIYNCLFVVFVLYNLGLMSRNYKTNGCKEYQTIYSPKNLYN